MVMKSYEKILIMFYGYEKLWKKLGNILPIYKNWRKATTQAAVPWMGNRKENIIFLVTMK